MGANSDEREAMALLAELEAEYVREAAHGSLYKLPSGQRIQIPNTPGDFRSWKNTLAELRRAARASDECAVEESDHLPEENPMPAAATKTAEDQGVFVQTRTQVLRIETRTYTVPMEALAAWLGIPEGSDVQVTDSVEGRTIHMPLTVVARTEVMEEE